MFDWTKHSDNPLEGSLLLKVQKILHNKISFEQKSSIQYVLDNCNGKKVLDVGIVEHAESFIENVNWKHNQISAISKYCIGIDIIESLINKLLKKGYNVKNVDATSEDYIGEKFDIVNIGDVIEHVNDPVKLMQFAKRHLNEKGKIIVSTPNPNFYLFIKSAFLSKMYVTNLDHLRWITPCQALEIGRRSNLNLNKIIFFLPKNLSWFKRKLRKLKPELFSMSYYYEFTN